MDIGADMGIDMTWEIALYMSDMSMELELIGVWHGHWYGVRGHHIDTLRRHGLQFTCMISCMGMLSEVAPLTTSSHMASEVVTLTLDLDMVSKVTMFFGLGMVLDVSKLTSCLGMQLKVPSLTFGTDTMLEVSMLTSYSDMASDVSMLTSSTTDALPC